MPSKTYHVTPEVKHQRSHTTFCSEPQALVNVCLTCPLPTCRPGNCKRYKTAELRLKFKVFPLVDLEVPKVVREPFKCDGCVFGKDVGGKVFCPLVECGKEDAE